MSTYYNYNPNLQTAHEGLILGYLVDSEIESKRLQDTEQASRERLYHLSDEEFYELLGRRALSPEARDDGITVAD